MNYECGTLEELYGQRKDGTMEQKDSSGTFSNTDSNVALVV
jgi:hypothetical protein